MKPLVWCNILLQALDKYPGITSCCCGKFQLCQAITSSADPDAVDADDAVLAAVLAEIEAAELDDGDSDEPMVRLLFMAIMEGVIRVLSRHSPLICIFHQ